jgi:hypothetical protein
MSIFDDEVRAGMNSYQAAMAKGMPPDQAEAYTHGLDVLGILDYTQLPAVLKQFQQMKQPPAQQLATPNVAQQIQMLANAKQGGRGLGAIRSGTMPYGPTSYVPPPVADPMMRGLGAMDAGAMENPKGFNMGGIVAFAGKDNEQLVQEPPIRAANLPRTDQEMFNYFYGLVGDGGEAAYKKARELREQREKEAGVGEFAKSFEEEQALLDTEEREAAGQTAQDIEDLGRQESADIAGAAAGSRSYLEAVSKARSKAVERERDFTVKVREATAARNRARIALTKSKETAKATGLASDKAAVEKAEERLIATERRLEDTRNRKIEADEALERAIKLKETEGPIDALEQARRNLLKAKPGSEEAAAAEDIIQGMSPSAGKMPTRYAAALRSAEAALKEARRAAVDLAGKPIPNDPRVKAAEENLRRVQQDIMAAGYDIPGLRPATGTPAGGATRNCTDVDRMTGVEGCV